MRRLPLARALHPRGGTAYLVTRPDGQRWMFIVDWIRDGEVYCRRFLKRGQTAECRGLFRMKLPTWRSAVRKAMREARG